MRLGRRGAIVAWVACAVLVAGGAGAGDGAEPRPDPAPAPRGEHPEYVPPRGAGGAPGTPVDLPVYVPPLGAPGGRTSAAVRGTGRQATLHLLAPDHLGLTTHEQPTLYWYVAEPSETRLEVTIRDAVSVKPLLEVGVPSPAPPGVHALRLADHGVRLEPGTDYQWFVSIVPDPERRSRDFTTSGWIRREAEPDVLRERLGLVPGREVFVYAESGLWYDAIEAVSSRIDAAPADPGPRVQRAALLEQVGLSEVAAYDRAGAGAR